ncbi:MULTISPECIES: IS5-like element ISMca7 family transposase [Methylococcus]|uniref:ISMca7, transposase n=2 Tax=Methylococcus capsulatus TaxID=414 RepID=Q60AG9_METCA|nr:IS5-like element ISMca7 family transposase [Methylococcus capsulatus]AAU92990.1 ISMca7, transposase [Methylococcus capsulatus str. Bath]QXP94637.1 IS5-like element ISMca7 family transposase [Methylococcus capsulatus]CAI8738960.1 Rac prophage; IS5 transposase and trans-activator [Methylococcus capsulatus]
MKQTTFASLAFDRKKKQTRREKFLAEMERAVPWPELLAVIEPHYPKAGRRGRQPYPLATMLRLYFLQHWYALSDPGLEDALYEIESMRRFAGLELADDALPDETTILNFRRLLERHALTAKLMNTINDVLEARGLLLKGGTMVDATIIHAAPSTKNKAKTRDPEMHQTKKGNPWFFGMKVHVGADVHTGVAHTVSVTPAHASDISQLPNLLREDDRLILGDAGYVNDTYKRAARQAGVVWGVALKARPKRRLGSAQKRRNRKLSSLRSRVEHLFRVMKRQFGYTKTRYRGLAKNAAQVFTLIGLTHLYLKRYALMT